MRRLRLAWRYGGWPCVAADLLPRRVVYWAAVRLMAAATQGPWADQDVPALYAVDALERWL